MADTIAELMVKIGADVADMKTGLHSLQEELKQSSASASAFGGLMTGVFIDIGHRVVESIAESVHALGEEQKALASVQAGLASTGNAAHVTSGQIAELAEKIEHKTGVDKAAIMSGQALMLTFTNIQNRAGAGNDIFNQATRAMVDMGAKFGSTQAAAMQLGKALQDPVEGFAALKRAGVSFTEAQKDQMKAMVEAGNLMGAQKVILKELAKETGGTAEAIGQTLPGAVGRFKGALEDMAKTAIEDYGPGAAKMIGGMADALYAINDVVAKDGLIGWLKSLLPESETARTALVAVAGAIVATMIPSIYESVTALAAQAAAWAASTAAMLAAVAPYAVIGATVSALAYLIYENWDGIREATRATWNYATALVQQAASGIALAVKTGLHYVAEVFAWLPGVVSSAMGSLYAAVKAWVADRLGAVWDWLAAKLQWVGNLFSSLTGGVVGSVKPMVDAVGGFATKVGSMFATVPQFAPPAIKAMTGLGDAAAGAGEKHKKAKQHVDELARATENMRDRLTEAAVEYKVSGDKLAYLEAQASAARDQYKTLLKHFSDGNPAVIAARENYIRLAAAAKALKEETEILNGNQAAFDKAIDEALAPTEKLAASYKELKTQVEELSKQASGGATFGDLEQGIDKANKALFALAERVGWSSPLVRALNEEMAKVEFAAGPAAAAIENNEKVLKTYGDALNQVKDTVGAATGFISSAITAMASESNKGLQESLALFRSFGNDLSKIAGDAFSKVKFEANDFTNGLASALGTTVTQLGGSLGEIGAWGTAVFNVMTKAADGLGVYWHAANDLAKIDWPAYGTKLKEAFSPPKETWGDTIRSLGDALKKLESTPLYQMSAGMKLADKMTAAFGDTLKDSTKKSDLVKTAIEGLIKSGLAPMSPQVQALVAQFKGFIQAEQEAATAAKQMDVMDQVQRDLAYAGNEAYALGTAYEATTKKSDIFKKAVQDLIKAGIDPASSAVKEMAGKFKEAFDAEQVAELAKKTAEFTKTAFEQSQKLAEEYAKKIADEASGIVAGVGSAVGDLMAGNLNMDKFGDAFLKALKQSIQTALTNSVLQSVVMKQLAPLMADFTKALDNGSLDAASQMLSGIANQAKATATSVAPLIERLGGALNSAFGTFAAAAPPSSSAVATSAGKAAAAAGVPLKSISSSSGGVPLSQANANVGANGHVYITITGNNLMNDHDMDSMWQRLIASARRQGVTFA